MNGLLPRPVPRLAPGRKTRATAGPLAAGLCRVALALGGVGVGLATGVPAPGQPPTNQDKPAAAADYTSAAALQERGLFDLAAGEWRSLLANHPDDALASRARYNLALSLFQLGEHSAAAKEFSVLTDPGRYPELAEGALANLGLARFNAAQQALAESDEAQAGYRAAVDALDQLLASYPESPQASTAAFYRAGALAALGDWTAAADAYARVAERHPGSPLAAPALLERGTALIELNRPKEAAEVLTKLIDRGDAEALLAEALHQRGEARLALERYPDAAADFARAARHPRAAAADASKLRHAYCLYESGDLAAAAVEYDALVTSWPESPLVAAARLSAAKCLVAADRHAEAAPRLEAIWEADPTATNAEAAHWLVRCLIATGDAERAAALADQAMAAAPAPRWAAEIATSRADLLAAAPDQKAAAADAYAAIADRFPDSPTGRRAACLAAQSALDAGQADRAVGLAEAALARGAAAEFECELLQIAAEAHQQNGANAAAAAAYRRLLATHGDDRRAGQWSLRLARCLAASADWRGVEHLLAGREQSSAPGRAAAALLLARAQEELADVEASIETLTAPIAAGEHRQSMPRLLFERGKRLARVGRIGAADDDFRRLVADYPESPEAPYARFAMASNHFSRGRFAECIDALDGFTHEGARGPVGEARFLLATALFERGEHTDALALLETAQAPDAEKHYLRGVCLSRLGRARGAQRALEQCLAADDACGVADRALYELAWVQDGGARQAKADALFARLADNYPNSPLAAEANYRLGASLYEAKKFDGAIDRLEAAARHAGGGASLEEQALHLLGWAWFDSARHDSAERCFERQIAASPTGPLADDARLMIGECRFAREEYAAAVDAYQTARDATGGREELRRLAMLHAGQAAGRLGDWSLALEWLDTGGAAGEPQADRVAYERAWALHKLGRNDEARPLLSRVASSADGPLGARARFVLGELQFAAKEYEPAVRTFFKVAYGYGGADAPPEYHEWQSQSLFEAARCLEQLDRSRPARKLYAELIERFPDSDKADDARQSLQSPPPR